MTVSGSPDVAIVLRSGADSEMTSGLGRERVRAHRRRPGRGPQRRRARSRPPNCSSSSICPSARPARTRTCRCAASRRRRFAVRDNIKIVEGRRFEPGRNEVIVGAGAARAFAGLEVGATDQGRPERVAGRRHLLRRRRHGRIGDLDGCHRAAARLPSRRHRSSPSMRS